MAFWIADFLVLASGYPGMNVFRGVNATRENIAAHMSTMALTMDTKKPVRLKRSENSCLWVFASRSDRRKCVIFLLSLVVLLIINFIVTLHTDGQNHRYRLR